MASLVYAYSGETSLVLVVVGRMTLFVVVHGESGVGRGSARKVLQGGCVSRTGRSRRKERAVGRQGRKEQEQARGSEALLL